MTIRLKTAPAALAVLAALVVTGARPASAHGTSHGDGTVVTDYRYEITSFDPGVDGIDLVFVGAIGHLQLTNRSGSEVTVLGYEDEPYLRVGPDGAFVNLRSPATYLNEDRDGSTGAPESADADADPRWERLSEDPVVRWHDHRAHWMTSTPAVVLSDPDSSHDLGTWTVAVEIDGRRVVAEGTTTWVPAPDGDPWAIAIAGITIVATLALASRWWRPMTAVLGGLLVIPGVALAIGAWNASPAMWSDKLTAAAVPALLVTSVAVGVVLLGRAPRDGSIIVAMGAGGLVLIEGVVRLGHLTSSQLPTTLPPSVDRVGIALVMSLGLGLLLGPIVRWTWAWLHRPVTPSRVANRLPSSEG